jgi:glycosyltransferase involved in cell wall biosynthesis
VFSTGRGAAYDARVAPRISVLVPCYDDGPTVKETVDSIVEDEQVEIVLIDDGSRDPRTIAVLDELASRASVRLIRQDNAGVAAALRAGTAVATAPYVFILNSDDLVEPGALAALADALDADPGADFAFGWIRFFGDVDFVARQPPWNPWVVLYSNRWSISSLFRREALDAVGGVPGGTGYEDWDLLLGFAEQDRRGVLVPRVVLHYRQHGPGRRNRGAQRGLRRDYAALRAKHAPLFTREPELRRRYPLPLRTRLAYRLQLQAGLLLPPPLVPRLLAIKLRLRGVGRSGTSGRAGAPGDG